MSTQELRLAVQFEIISRLEDVGKIQLQKLTYFLQEEMDVPTEYPYRMHHYGPYSEGLETDTTRLKFAGYVDVQPDSGGYGFHITRTDNPREEWASLREPYSEEINRVVEIFAGRRIPELELMATIHYMRNLRPNLSNKELLEMVRALKPKFSEGYVNKVHNEMEVLGLIRGI